MRGRFFGFASQGRGSTSSTGPLLGGDESERCGRGSRLLPAASGPSLRFAGPAREERSQAARRLQGSAGPARGRLRGAPAPPGRQVRFSARRRPRAPPSRRHRRPRPAPAAAQGQRTGEGRRGAASRRAGAADGAAQLVGALRRAGGPCERATDRRAAPRRASPAAIPDGGTAPRTGVAGGSRAAAAAPWPRRERSERRRRSR